MVLRYVIVTSQHRYRVLVYKLHINIRTVAFYIAANGNLGKYYHPFSSYTSQFATLFNMLHKVSVFFFALKSMHVN